MALCKPLEVKVVEDIAVDDELIAMLDGQGQELLEHSPICGEPAPADGAGFATKEVPVINTAFQLPEGSFYLHPDDPAAKILLPRDKSFIDFALRMSEVLHALQTFARSS